ncbi:MAG: N-6 DNA methylase [Sarcina sp.]
MNILTIPEGKVCDYIDGKFRDDTPEEYVRQNIEKRLVNEHKYEKERIQIEYILKNGSRKPRADIVIFPENCEEKKQENIEIMIECKKEQVEPSNKKEGVEQLKSYMSICVNCEWGMWTNGRYKEVIRKVINEKGTIEFLEYNDIPPASGKIDDVDRPKRPNLRNAVEDNLLFVFKTCHNYIYINDGMQKQPAFFEFLKIIFCKIEDEKNIPHPLEFYSTSDERRSGDGQLSVKKRISSIFEKVKKKYNKIFDINDEIKLSPRSLAYIVSELQMYSLLNTNIDIKGKAYEELVGANLRGDRGEFFTPRNVMKMTVEMMNPKEGEKVLDPSCGTGGFVVMALNHVVEKLEKSMSEMLGREKDKWNYEERKVFQEKISEVAIENFFGFDINPDLVKATEMNMEMNNDRGNILRTDSLLQPHEWTADFKEKLAKALKIDENNIRSYKDIEFFDLILSNPPFGSKIPVKDPSMLKQYELAYIWEFIEGKWCKTDRLQSSVPPEQLFIERCYQLLKPGGRLGIVLPDSILGAPGLEYLRYWILTNMKLIASLDLHVDTFQPRNGTQCSVLILQKKTVEEKKNNNEQTVDYNIFMAMVEKIGHDKRGNTIFKRDKDGNEILVDEEIVVTDQNKVVLTHTKSKVVDDQTVLVPKIFEEWKKQEGVEW